MIVGSLFLRRTFGAGLALAVCAMLCAPVAAREAEDDDAEWAAVERAAQRGAEYLLNQQHQDGAIVENNRYKTTMTSLAIMALCAVGHQPADQTREGEALRKALGYVLHPDRQDKDGYFGSRDGSRMYGHGIITLMLAEVLGMGVDEAQDKVIRERLQKAIDLMLRAQRVRKDERNRGGWRYSPTSGDSDLSVTVWQLLSLRAAKNAGIDVPKEAIDKGVAYVKRCYKSPRDSLGHPTNMKSFFCYQPNDNRIRFGSGAGGFLVLQICGGYDAREVVGAADYFLDYDIPDKKQSEHFFYGMYYYSQGMYQRKGKYAEHARRKVREILLPTQEGDGRWNPGSREGDAGKVYATSLAMLSLSIYYHYLPIYQR